MESYAAPLRALAERAAWFVRARDTRFFHVVAAHALRDAALEVITAQEYHADNRSPFLVLHTSHTARDPGWLTRAEALRRQHDARRREMPELPALPAPPPAQPGAAPVIPFAQQIHQLLAVTTPQGSPLEGLVVVLAPGHVESPARWEEELLPLFDVPALRDVRWILLDLERPSAPNAVKKFGASVLTAECRVDESAAQRDLAERIESAAAAAPDAPGQAQAGAAWPRGVLPPGATAKKLSPEEQAALAAKMGVPLGYFSASMRAIRPKVLRAALAMRRGDALAAVEAQREACQGALEAGLQREALLMEIVMATYVVHAGLRPRALELYLSCAERAEQNDWADLAAQSLLSGAALCLVDRDRDRAAALYARAGAVAEKGGEQSLAIEGYRMAGQLRAEARDEQTAIQFFTQALSVAGELPVRDAGQTSAPLAARALAALCRKRGLNAQARSLEEQSARMEQQDSQTAQPGRAPQ